MTPRFAVLDVVEVAGERAVVTQVRRYADGHRYAVAGAAAGHLFDEELLAATGERASPEEFAIPGPFRVREVVRLPDGRTGVLSDGFTEDPDTGEVRVCVWLESDRELVDASAAELTSTGERRPPAPRGRIAESTRVGEDGAVRGTSSYVIVDEIDQYL